jgi:uncharacterized protein with PIN domain
MGIFDEKMTQPVILKEDSSLDEWLNYLPMFVSRLKMKFAIICSKCGAPMVKRVKEVASKGIEVGEEFLGCSRYPFCENILKLS